MASTSQYNAGFPGMEQWIGKVAVITGASAGIGYSLANRLVSCGMNVVGCARHTTKIEVSHEY